MTDNKKAGEEPKKTPVLWWPRRKIKQLYAWTVKWAQTKHAERSLGGLTFAESTFFPIPPDPLLMAMTFAKPRRWARYALIATIASVLGAIAGYYLGFALFESAGDWIISTYHLQDEYNSLGQSYQDSAALAVFAAAFTPIPFKIITLSAGAFKINFLTFLLAAILGRAARFFAVAWVAHFLGKKYKDQIESYIDIISLILLAIIIVLVVIVSQT